MKSIKITKYPLFTFMLLIILTMAYFLIDMMNKFTDVTIQIFSIISIITYVYIVYSWKKSYYRILSPYFIFVTALYLTLCGQSIPWAFGLVSGYRDLKYATYGTIDFSSYGITKALVYALLCILVMHFVVLLKVNYKTKLCNSHFSIEYNKDYLKMNKKLYQRMMIIGLTLIIVTALPYIITFVKTYNLQKVSAYGSQYSNVAYGIDSIWSKIADFFPLGILTLLYIWGSKNEYNKINYVYKHIIALFATGAYIITQLMLSQRTDVILFAISLMFIFYKDKKISAKKIVLGAFIGIVFMALMRVVDLMRSGGLISLEDVMYYLTMPENNPVMDFLGDIGWNLMTTIKFQEVIPSVKGFGLGLTYLISLTSIIPNLNFWTIHPAYSLGNISLWLQKYLGFSFGIGCTPVAEAYYNFGFFGIFVFIFWGLFLVGLNKDFESKSILKNYRVVLFMGILLKSTVRSSFFAVFRPYILLVILPIFLIKLLCKKY